jgi:hypothetical protein
MAELDEPRLGLKYGWNLGESEFKTGMDINLIKLGAIYGLSVLSRTVLDPPTSPVNGDLYLLPALSTGAWVGQDGNLAYWINGWRFYSPVNGWQARIEDEENVITSYLEGDWTDDFPLGNGLVVVTGSGSGTKFGKDIANKLAFYGSAPVSQQSDVDQLAVSPDNSDEDIGGLPVSATYQQSEIISLRDQTEIVADDMRKNNVLLNEIRRTLVNLGLIKGAA